MSYIGTLTVPYRFITIFIITHGEDIKERTIGSFNATTQEGIYETFKSLFRTKTNQLNAKPHFKLTVSGLTGNITTGSDTVDAIYSQLPRILAHDRTMSPLQKLKAVRKKMHSEFFFKHEVEAQSKGQLKFIGDRSTEYQRIVSRNENWFPDPTLITYDRAYYFSANPIDYEDRTSTVMERNEFGVWLLDASLDIATELKLRPGCETEPLSLLEMLGISLSTARTHDSSDETGATSTTLFIIMAQLMQRFGNDIHINVVDVTCRYFNWDQYRPGVEKWHNLGSKIQSLGTWLTDNVSSYVGSPLLYAGDITGDGVPSADATELANEYKPEHVVSLDGSHFPVEKWYYDGNIKLSGLDNVLKLKIRKEGSSVVVTSTRLLSTGYNLIPVLYGHLSHTIYTTTLFTDDVHDQDRIVNGQSIETKHGTKVFENSIETTHDIEVFHVLRTSPVKIIVTLKCKSNSIASSLPTDTNAYLTLESISQLSHTTFQRQWKIGLEPIPPFFRQVYNTVARIEAVTRSKRQKLDITGGRKKQKKRRTRRLRVKTNKSKKTRFRYSASYRK
jgi:hypothetical protein